MIRAGIAVHRTAIPADRSPAQLRALVISHVRTGDLRRSIPLLGIGVPLILSVALILSGCAVSTPLSDARRGATSSYNSKGITEWSPGQRKMPIRFSGPLDSGGSFDSRDSLGSPVVVNFWYAACPPCRAEAPDLKAVSEEYGPRGVVFVGVNVRDQAPTSLQFSRTFGIPYPSILDVESASVQLAFAGSAAPNAVPTTLVLDRKGRVAARIIGRIPSRSVLTAMINTALKERP